MPQIYTVYTIYKAWCMHLIFKKISTLLLTKLNTKINLNNKYFFDF